MREPARNAGELRYRLRCIDKLGHQFRGDERLLDVGRGGGGVSLLLRERVRDVVGVDIKPSPAWSSEAGLEFRVADGEALPFEDASFDVVHERDSLNHMQRPQRALAECRRVLRPGGTALIVEANRYNPSLYLQMTLVRGHQHFVQLRRRVGVKRPDQAPRAASSRAMRSAWSRRTTPSIRSSPSSIRSSLESIPSKRA